MRPSIRAMNLMRYMKRHNLMWCSTCEVARLRHQSEAVVSDIITELEDCGYMQHILPSENAWYPTEAGTQALEWDEVHRPL